MPTTSDSAIARQRLAILVDPDEQSRLGCRAALSEAGFEVITASDPETALLVARIVPPDLLILDPKAAGQQLLDALGGSLVIA